MTTQEKDMTSAEARDILWDFSKNLLDGMVGAYYVNLRNAIKVLYDESYYNEVGAQPTFKDECNPTCGCSQ